MTDFYFDCHAVVVVVVVTAAAAVAVVVIINVDDGGEESSYVIYADVAIDSADGDHETVTSSPTAADTFDGKSDEGSKTCYNNKCCC